MPAKRIAPAHCRHGSSDVQSAWPSTAWRHRTFESASISACASVDPASGASSVGCSNRRLRPSTTMAPSASVMTAPMPRLPARNDAHASSSARRKGASRSSQWGPIRRHRNLRDMRCEVVAVGTELLLGQIVDTNSSWIGEQLALAGIDSHFQTKVGDNRARIVESFRLALQRSDAVIVCGGLGPTQDDITRDALAEVMGVELVRDQAIADLIRHMFESRGRTMAENNLLQADVPVGASIIEQRRGTAPGLICPVTVTGEDGEPVEKVMYAVPGVPYEMTEMMERAILPDLRLRAGEPSTILSRTLRTWGDSESGLAERLADRITELDERGNPTLAFLASGIEGLKVRITAKGPDEVACRELLAHEEGVLRSAARRHRVRCRRRDDGDRGRGRCSTRRGSRSGWPSP